MKETYELIFLQQANTPCHLATLASSMEINTKVIHRFEDIPLPTEQNNQFYFISQQISALNNHGFPKEALTIASLYPTALYQVTRDSIEPKTALLYGFRGLLFQDDGMDLLISAVDKLSQDELWYNRALLSNVCSQLLKPNGNSAVASQENLNMLQTLTEREKSIIQLISNGYRNKEIAVHLCISEHTVKAHLSSIFRKTQSRNRVELLCWTQNMQQQFILQ